MKVSVLGLTWNREELTKQVYDYNLSRTGTDDFELMVCDQGSQDSSFIEYLKNLNTTYLRLNKCNEGISRSLNQLIIRAKNDHHVFFMPNDILLPDNWLKNIAEYANEVPYAGIVGFEGQDLILPELTIIGKSGKEITIRCETKPEVYQESQVLGAVLLTRDLLNCIGGWDEYFHPYGFEDQDINFRSKIAGFLNFYIPGQRSKHLGVDIDSDNYKEAKTFSFWSNIGNLRWKSAHYHQIGVYFPFPQMRDPLV